MKLINQTFEILTPISENGLSELKHIERIARVCYKSEDLISEDGESAKRLISALIRNKHEAMLEHGSISVLITTNRGVSHELVRHRIASYAQESTRYCNYSKDKFNNELTFIYPWSLLDESRLNDLIIWERAMQNVENTYMQMINDGVSPQEARSILPNSLKTDIVITANYREWRNIFKLRCAKTAHPDIRDIMLEILGEFHDKIPVIFDDIWKDAFA